MEKIINDTLAQFELIKRGDDNIIILKSEAPEALRDSVRSAHGDSMPNDWIYNKYQSVLEALSGYTINSIDDLSENLPEIVDGLVDVYTSDLTAWLNSKNSNVYYLTEALQEWGGNDADGFRLLMLAQYKAIDEIASEVITYLTAQLEGEAE